MGTDDTDNTDKENNKHGLHHEQLTYAINGLLFSTHNEVGQYGREKQYGDVFERLLREKGIKYQREVRIGNSGNILDFLVEDKVPVELKAKRILIKDDYNQMQRYLQETQLLVGILVNFRDKYIKPKRIVKIDNWKR